MELVKTKLADVFILKPKVFKDPRGFFLESWNKKTFKDTTGIDVEFVQDSHSHSLKGVLRGIHYQIKNPQAKLVRVVTGKVLDVVLDISKSSPTFGQHFTIELSSENHKQLLIPETCAHGFLVLTEYVDMIYKVTNYYLPDQERCIKYDDSDLNINWCLNGSKPRLSKKDQQGVLFEKAEYFL